MARSRSAWLLSALILSATGMAAYAQRGPASAQLLSRDVLDTDAKIMREIRAHSQVLENLEYLSDMIGPRLTGSDKLHRANEWTLQKFKEYGLSNAHLEPFTIPNGWSRVQASARILSPNTLPLTIAAAGWSPGTSGRVEGDVVFVDANSETEFEKYRGKLKHALVLTRPPSTVAPPSGPKVDGIPTPLPPEQPDSQPGRAFSPQDRTFRRRLMGLLQAEGAACLLMDSGKEHGLLNMSQMGGSQPCSPGDLPAAFVTHEGYAQLWRLLKRGSVRAEIQIENRFTEGPVTVYNTVAELPGSERPDEVVLIGAHLDSWDLGTGSTDNGTGSMALLEAARTLQALGLKPKRTIRFVLFAGEEEGLLGSKAYVKAHTSDLSHYSGVLVHDLGTGKVDQIVLGNHWECGPAMEAVTGPLRAVGFDGIRNGRLYAGATDHTSFDDAGVPGFVCLQDPAEYGKTHHSQSDTFDKAWGDDLKQGAMVLAVWSYNVASLPELLPRAGTTPRTPVAGAAAGQ